MSAHDLTADLFDTPAERARDEEVVAPGALLLRGLLDVETAASVVGTLDGILAQAPLRHMTTPSGHRMSVAMSNCGRVGWVTDQRGYRYVAEDPLTGRPWPEMPACFLQIAGHAAARAGYAAFEPDACLISRYAPGARLTLHQDRDERDPRAPIVALSLGLPAIFLFGGARRREPVRRLRLGHGDAVVWGGPARLWFHGVSPLADGCHSATGRCRFNLSFRRAG